MLDELSTFFSEGMFPFKAVQDDPFDQITQPNIVLYPRHVHRSCCYDDRRLSNNGEPKPTGTNDGRNREKGFREITHINKTLEWGGAILSIAYSLFIASNSGYEVLSFVFFLLAALLHFTLAVRKRMWGMGNDAGILHRHGRRWDLCLERLGTL